MKKTMILILLLSLLLPTAHAASTADEATSIMQVRSVTNPTDQNKGQLNARMLGGVLMIDYDEALLSTFVPIHIQLTDPNGNDLPGEGRLAYLRNLSPDGLLDPSQEGMPVGNNALFHIFIDPTVKKYNLQIETEKGLYQSQTIPVLWRVVPLSPTMRVDMYPGREFSIGIKQEIKMDIQPVGLSTDVRLSLQTSGYDRFVAFDPHTFLVEGLSLGKQILLVQNGEGATIDTIEITVQSAPVALPTPVSPVQTKRYRVLPRNLLVYSQNNEMLPPIGQLPSNFTVYVVKTVGDYSLLSMDVWVPSSYLSPL